MALGAAAAAAAPGVFVVSGGSRFSSLKSQYFKLKFECGIEMNLNGAQTLKARVEEVAMKTKV